jgi:uncharacterized protein (DUF302 family)
MQVDGVLSLESRAAFTDTVERLVASLQQRGLTLFARLDHAAGAAAAGLALRPTQLLVFGNARGGTPLMQAQQQLGLELPLRVLVWQDEALRTWVSHPDLQWTARRYGLPETSAAAVAHLAAVLKALVREATATAEQDQELDTELEETFPASDPLPWSHDTR